MFMKRILSVIYMCAFLCAGISFADNNSGIQDGTYTEHYSNGNIRQESTYKDKKLTKFKTFYSNGNLEREDNYLNGIRHGVSLHLYDNGDIKGKEEYDNGRLIFTEGYNKKGEVTTYLDKDTKTKEEIDAEYILTVDNASWATIFEDTNLDKKIKITIIKDINKIHEQLYNYAVLKHKPSRQSIEIDNQAYEVLGFIHLGDDKNYSVRPDIFSRESLMTIVNKGGNDTIVIPKVISKEYERMIIFWQQHNNELSELKDFINFVKEHKSSEELSKEQKEDLFYLQLTRESIEYADLMELKSKSAVELLKAKFANHSIIHQCSYYEDLMKKEFESYPEIVDTMMSIPGANKISLICTIPFVDKVSGKFIGGGMPLVYADGKWHFYWTDAGE